MKSEEYKFKVGEEISFNPNMSWYDIYLGESPRDRTHSGKLECFLIQNI